MKERTAMQHYCLDVMGITRWVDRTTLHKRFSYLVFIDNEEKEGISELSFEKQKLLARMLQALNWPSHEIKTIFIDTKNSAFEEYFQKYQPKKILLFNLPNMLVAPHIQIAELPSLRDILTKPEAKKQAWKMMKPLVGEIPSRIDA